MLKLLNRSNVCDHFLALCHERVSLPENAAACHLINQKLQYARMKVNESLTVASGSDRLQQRVIFDSDCF